MLHEFMINLKMYNLFQFYSTAMYVFKTLKRHQAATHHDGMNIKIENVV
jgi:hypothetical protein